MSPKDAAGEIREQNLRKLQEHLEKLKKHGGNPPKEEEADLMSEVERARAEFARDFAQDFGTWERLYGEDIANPAAAPLRDRSADFRLLGVSQQASKEEIRRAFYGLAKQHHPDKGGDVAKFRDLMAAYRSLSAK